MGFYDRMKEARERMKVGDKPTYKVLQSSMVRSSDKERICSIASFVRTGEEAYKLAGHDNFFYQGLDRHGRCGVVRYNGIEVALLFKREIVEVEPGPSDPVPERTLKEPAEAWIQINLLDIEQHVQESSLADRFRKALSTIENLRLLRTQEITDRKAAEARLEKFTEERLELVTLRNKVERYETLIAEQILDVENLKRQLGEEKRARKADQIRLVEELFPVFNTVWLAGLHRVGDKLYGMLQKQLVDALDKIGVSLIEPELGDEFNPALHHAIHTTQFPEGSKQINAVVQVSRVGWSIASQVISAAEVIVGVEQEVVVEQTQQVQIEQPEIQKEVASNGQDDGGGT
jgi:molecular chaperone GrpE